MLRSERLLAAALVLLLGVGAVAAATVGGSDHEPASAVAPVVTPSPTATATPAPTPTAKPAATTSPTPPPPKPTPRLAASPPNRLTTTSASARSGPYAPLSGTYTLSPGAGSTQTPFALTIDLRDGDGRAQVDQVVWGDGDSYRPNPGPAYGTCPVPSPTPSGQPYRPGPSHSTVRYGHAWRHPGTYRVTVQLISYPWPCTGSTAQTQHTEGRLTLRIRAGRQTTNGPALPVIGPITLTQSVSVPRSFVSFPEWDTDGEIESIGVDWGDGNHTGQVMDGICDDGSGAYYPGTQHDETAANEFSHQYARHGRYHVVVSVYSAGCTSVDMQHTSRSVEVRY